MKTINELKKTLPQKGELVSIGIRPERKQTLDYPDRVSVEEGTGLVGDHFSNKGGDRQVTLIQKEHMDLVGEILNKPSPHGAVRRNLLISGINVLSLQDAQFSIGNEVVLQGTGYCHPCSRMEENLGPGGYNAMRGHGGITAKVIRGGEIAIGDSIALHNES